MPTYEYRCENCGHEFEQFQSITASPLRKCSSCDKMTLKRLIGAGSGIIFKGSGFYQTDYRTENYKNGAKNVTTAGNTEKKTESKSEAKDSKDSKDSKTTAPAKEPNTKPKKKTN